MEYSVFYPFLKVTNARESSANLIVELCKLYDVKNQKFVFNSETTFSFCAKEVAHVLGINDTGNDYNAPTASKIPLFVADLKREFSLKEENKLSSTDLKSILTNMRIETPDRELSFKKLISFSLVDQMLLCSIDPKVTRCHFWELVKDLKVFEEINWAKAVYDRLLVALEDLKKKVEDENNSNNKPLVPNTSTVQHCFKGSAPVLEAVLFERIEILRPKDLRDKFPDPPIQNYATKRTGIAEKLHTLISGQIHPCKHCGSETALEDGACFEASSLAEVAPEKNGATTPKEASPKHRKESKKANTSAMETGAAMASRLI